MLMYICLPHHNTSKKGHDVIQHLELRFPSDLLQEQKQSQTFIIKHPYNDPNGKSLVVSEVPNHTAIKQFAKLMRKQCRRVGRARTNVQHLWTWPVQISFTTFTEMNAIRTHDGILSLSSICDLHHVLVEQPLVNQTSIYFHASSHTSRLSGAGA